MHTAPHPGHDIGRWNRALTSPPMQTSRPSARELFQPAIQTVFGTGNPAAEVLLGGEQPGMG
jgi:hypothetical protein